VDPIDVVYESIDGAPGRYFRCTRYSLMTDTRCASNYALAPEVVGEGRLAGCIRCAVGEGHARQTASGAAQTAEIEKLADTQSNYLGACVRCRRDPTDESEYRDTRQGRMRMVRRGELCVSCFNREREVVKGRNARKTKPRLVLREVHLTRLLDGRASVQRIPLAIDAVEAALTIFRRSSAQAMVGRAPQQGLRLRDPVVDPPRYRTASDERVLFALVDHVCSYCTGRLLKLANGLHVRYECNSCGAFAEVEVESLCCCGLPGYECIRNPGEPVEGDGSPEVVVLDHNLPVK